MKTSIRTLFQLTPVIISLLLIGAHFFRYGNIVLTAAVLVLICSLFIRNPIAARIIQAALLMSTVEWIRTALILISARADSGLPWNRLALILGGVALFTFFSIFVFLSKSLKERYGLGKTARGN